MIPKIIAVDFDGTCCTPMFPLVGDDIGAAIVLKHLQGLGHHIMCWTMRGNTDVTWFGQRLDKTFLEAVHEWEELNDFKFNAYNKTEGNDWTDSPKQYADLYIDDMALGCPLRAYKFRVAADWTKIIPMLADKGYIYDKDVESLIRMVKDRIADVIYR